MHERRRRHAPSSPLVDEVAGRPVASAEGVVAEAVLRSPRVGAVRADNLSARVLSHAHRARDAATRMPPVIARLAPRTLVELGAGSAAKTRLLLDAMRASGEPATYVPIDVSAEFLSDTASR